MWPWTMRLWLHTTRMEESPAMLKVIPPLCFNCGKPGHYACNFWKRKDNNREMAHKARVEDHY
jgi:hypothetical protein